MTKIPTMCKVLNIGAHKDARQNENKIYRHCVSQCEWALRPKEFTVMNVIRAGEYRNNWMFIVRWCQQSPSEQLWWSFFYFRDGRCSSKCHSLSRYLLCQLIFRLSNWQKTNSYVWIIFFFIFHQYKMMIFFKQQGTLLRSNPFLSCRTHCICSILKCNNAYSCMTASISPCPSAKWRLSPSFTHRHELYLCQASTSKIPRWQVVFYNLDL